VIDGLRRYKFDEKGGFLSRLFVLADP